MTINERMRYFRKDVLHMNQTDFANSIGMKQTGVSYMERDGSTVTDQAIKATCSIYGVNEEWLRNGTEPMYIKPETFNLDEFAKKRGASDLELKVVKAYFELDPDIRKMLIEHFKAELMDTDSSDHPKTPEELEEQYPVEEEGSGLGAG